MAIKTTTSKTAPETAKPATPAKVSQKTVPTDRIDRDPNQPREVFDQEKLDELAASMKVIGQLQPISVRYIPTTRRYTIVMGERRWRAAQQAGLPEMHCLVLHGIEEGDPETFAKAVAENVGRVDMTPLEEGKAFQKLIDFGYTMEEVATVCGKSLNFVELRVDLLKLSLSMQEALIKGHVPVGLAWYVACLAADNQNRFLARFTRGEFPTVRDAEAFAQACRKAEEEQASQGSFFVLSEDAVETMRTSGGGQQADLLGGLDLPDDKREQLAADRRLLLGKIDRLSAAGAILAEIATMDPAELAMLLAGAPGGLPAQRMRVDYLKEMTGKATTALRQASAVAAVRAGSLRISPDIAPDAAPDAAPEAASDDASTVAA
ncbi:ParB/RepB/Spo0J family partition protein [Streptosporangium sp. NPDC000563]|uniref:ParB/RepB/Spo0J family partition protein n=1 Tax=Streptosporangium sp. NPDC000563 TaxID=3154366 RepID=UPI003316E9B6